MITHPVQLQSFVDSLDMSNSLKKLWYQFLINLNSTGSNSAAVVKNFLSMISEVLPVALSVAGAILVVTLGWRLFRNFTKG